MVIRGRIQLVPMIGTVEDVEDVESLGPKFVMFVSSPTNSSN